MTVKVQKLSNYSKPRSVSPAGSQLKVFVDYVFLNKRKRELERKILNRKGNKKHTRKGSAGTRCFDSHIKPRLGVWSQFLALERVLSDCGPAIRDQDTQLHHKQAAPPPV